MVQVRCPECGYLQTLSEERFLTISDDFLNCPHCNARVPKQWTPAAGESVPEEVQHKMLAFSRRILNGGDVGREVVLALESLVRHHGATAESNRALGFGYANLGEAKKAEEFLLHALQEEPDDPEILKTLLEVLVVQKKFVEAVEAGRSLVELCGAKAEDEDVARLALALAALERTDEAEALLGSYPTLDVRNPIVKKARKELNRKSGLGLAAFFGEKGPFQKLLRRGGHKDLALSDHDSADRGASAYNEPAVKHTRPTTRRAPVKPYTPMKSRPQREKLHATMEYWVYTLGSTTPNWENVKAGLAAQYGRKPERARVFKFLESLIERNDLAVDYILREKAPDLFNYPEEMIPTNSRDFPDEDRNTLMNAQMIVRLRLSLKGYSGVQGLIFMVRLVESVRGLTDGVVQDAVSHTLWGTEQWKKCAQNPKSRLMDVHIQIEMLDEGGEVWIHSHGMQKFGLPDLEIDGVPAQMASSGRELLIQVGRCLVEARDSGVDYTSPVTLRETPVIVRVEPRPRDEEGHFPAGSLLLHAHVPGRDPEDPDTLKEVLTALESKECPSAVESDDTESAAGGADRLEEPPAHADAALREKLLLAHKEAKKELPCFKRSFMETEGPKGYTHAVKVGFPTQEGTYEWMWVSLSAWRGNALVGHLQNSPVLRTDLSKGTRVQISEGQIFDWVIAREGELLKGPYTEQIVPADSLSFSHGSESAAPS